jgi:hypothetical protein
MGRARQRGHLNPRPTRKTSRLHDPPNNPSQLAAAGEKPCPNDWPCRTTTEVNPPQRSTKQREKSGLTMEETIEFGALDALAPFDDSGNIAWSFEGGPTTRREKRRLELYLKKAL